jgi:hypothetical protein
MFGLYELPPAQYGDRRASQLYDWEMRTGRSRGRYTTPADEHIQNLMSEAQDERLYKRLPHGVSWADRSRVNAQAWLDEARCRLHSFGFGQPCPEAAR